MKTIKISTIEATALLHCPSSTALKGLREQRNVHELRLKVVSEEIRQHELALERLQREIVKGKGEAVKDTDPVSFAEIEREETTESEIEKPNEKGEKVKTKVIEKKKIKTGEYEITFGA